MAARSLAGQQQNPDFSAAPRAIDRLLVGNPAEIGIAVRRLNGQALFLYNSQQPFPLASVAKVYMLAAYLDRLEDEGRTADEEEIELLQDMIEVSDNYAAEEIWTRLGKLEAMQSYLGRSGLKYLLPPPVVQQMGGAEEYEIEPEAWGDAGQSAGEMSLFLARLHSQRLLGAQNTLLANSILGSVVEEHRWGINAGIERYDPEAEVWLKNGWYPIEQGWRINSAGIVLPSGGKEPYILVIFGQHFESWDEGVQTVEAIAQMINRAMLD